MLKSILGTSSTYSIVRRTETHQEVKSCSCCPPVSLGLYGLVRALSFPNVPGQEGDSQDARQGPLAHTPGLPVLSREPAAHRVCKGKPRSWSVPSSERPLSPGISIPRADVLFCKRLSHSETVGCWSAHRWMQIVWKVRVWLWFQK